MAKSPIILGDPPSQEVAAQYIGYTKQLMEELHGAHLRPNVTSLPPSPDELEGWLHSGPSMVEAIFYGEEGAYPWQYLRLAPRRYRKDAEWIQNFLGTSLETIIDMANTLLRSRFLKFRISRPDNFESFCRNLLDIFCFTEDDMGEEPQVFLNHFSVVPGPVNEQLTTIGMYNEVLSKPILKLQDKKYILPIPSNLARAVYENPYYWMKEDSAYSSVVGNNRGAITEEIAEELLVEVFGRPNVYRNVKLRKNGKDITDIDTLVLYRNKALIIQAKSKRLTETARTGDISTLQADFQKAIQDAYHQALVSHKAVLDGQPQMISGDGQPVGWDEHINECYIVCITADHYPATIMQVEYYLQNKIGDPNPLVVSLFDLDTIKDFLPSPIEMLYYIRQRSHLVKKSIAISEMDYLGWHMARGLPRLRKVDSWALQMAETVDAELMRSQMEGMVDPKPSLPKPKWQTNSLSPLMEDLKRSPEPGITDAIFWLYDLMTDLEGSWADEIAEKVKYVKEATHRDEEPHSMSWMPFEEKAGLSLLCFPNMYDLAQQLGVFTECKKYVGYSDEWLSLGFVHDSPASYDLAAYIRSPWQDDQQLAEASRVVLKGGTAIGRGKKKTGRNSLCPCGSGKKFKRCHLR